MATCPWIAGFVKGSIRSGDLSAYTEGSSIQDASLRAKAMDLEPGFLGKFFDGANTAPSNIAGFMLVSLAQAGILFTLFQPSASADFWKYTTPIITLVFGFLSGKKV
jgi:hypothetical protein